MPQALLYYTTVLGGQRAGAVYSGQVAPVLTGLDADAFAVGSDIMLQSGRGRVCRVMPHGTYLALSGVQLNLYDGAAPVSGGPLPASGHTPLGGLPAAFGVSGQIVGANVPIDLSMPFTSGLCLNSRSGQAGVTVTWIIEPFVGISG